MTIIRQTSHVKKYIYLVVLILLSVVADAQVAGQRSAILMGGRFDFTLVASSEEEAQRYIDTVIAEVARIENLISDWKHDSQVSDVNRNAGIRPVKVDREVFELTQRAIYFSRITNGAFDISFAAMERIWKFDGSMDTLPSPGQVKASVAKVGYKNIILDSAASTIFLKLPGMKIGFGALGEGYAADRCREMMLAKGIRAGIVNATGDMSTWGKQPNGNKWKIGIANPKETGELLAVITVQHGAVTTSGSYEKYAEINGVRYSHIINPSTGYPATGLTSVTVTGPGAETANALSTSIMVLGEKEGLKLLKKFRGYSCILITDKGKIRKSKNWRGKKMPSSI